MFMSEKRIISLQDAVNEFVDRVRQRDPGCRIEGGQVLVANTGEVENYIKIDDSQGRTSVYSVWKNYDGTVGGTKWI